MKYSKLAFILMFYIFLTLIPLNATLEDDLILDGKIDWQTLKGKQTQALIFEPPGGMKKTPKGDVTWAYTYDVTWLYLAVEWEDDDWNNNFSMAMGPRDVDTIHLLIDNNNNLTYEGDEDRKYVVTADTRSTYIDATKKNFDQDTTGNGYGIVRYHEKTGKYSAEFLVPFVGDIEEELIGDVFRFNLVIMDHLVIDPDEGVKRVQVARLAADELSSKEWPVINLPREETLPPEPASFPKPSGLIIFRSTHENKKGEIYSFDPASRKIKRITDNDLREDTISLSPDRKKIAFMGSVGDPYKDIGAFGECEIYTVNVDGTDLKKLTSNKNLDGHPGWSLGSKKIVYAAYLPDINGSHIMMMDADGKNQKDLTAATFKDYKKYFIEENDPDFLTADSIIFKTNRFFKFKKKTGNDNQLQLARLDLKTMKVIQVTKNNNVVDHDPIGNGKKVMFERLNGNLDYTDLPGAFGPWQIVEADADGSGKERILIDDEWINWLPVYAPGSKYFIYIRSCGYSECRLVDLETGRDLGRFIPWMTQIQYMDWK
ncbi:MAG: PD40 domain-containing protein [Spirochaetales bacterium]|nr:PD40 domain-containing protein [Spirochaetales bacterium]